MEFTIRQIAEAAEGRLVYTGDETSRQAFLDRKADSVVLDSRQVTAGGVFIATVGERVDGHSFVSSVFEQGAVLAVVQREPKEGEHWQNYLVVEDTLLALKKIGESYRRTLGIPVIGITGSVGKTSTKEFVAGVLSEKYKVLKTEGNYNNEIGVPLTLLRIRPEHEVAVVEMGISDFGEMHRLSKMARPDVAVITNIGQCHLENLKDRDGVLRAKTEIFDFMPAGGKICLNAEDDKLRTVSAPEGCEVRYFGRWKQGTEGEKMPFPPGECGGIAREPQEGTAVYATDIAGKGLWGSDAVLHNAAGDKYAVEVPLPGEHMVLNAAAAACVAEWLELTPEQIRTGIKKMTAVGGRNNLIRTERMTLIDDCYNANPVSMKAGIDLLCMADTVKVAILGDMFELGENSDAMHAEVGSYAATKGVDRIICVGGNSRHMYEAAKNGESGGRVEYFKTREALLEALDTRRESLFPDGSTVLIKASHGMRFAEVVEKLR